MAFEVVREQDASSPTGASSPFRFTRQLGRTRSNTNQLVAAAILDETNHFTAAEQHREAQAKRADIRSIIKSHKLGTRRAKEGDENPSVFVVESNDSFDIIDYRADALKFREQELSVKIRLALYRARSLKARPKGEKRNPFVVIRTLRSQQTPFTTSVVQKSLNPVWGTVCEFNHVSNPWRETLNVSILDQDKQVNEMIGSFDIPLAQFRKDNLNHDQVVIGGRELQWYSVRDGSRQITGEVELRIEVLHHFTPPVSRSSSADSAGGQAVSDVSRRASASSASTTIGPIDTARTGEDTLQEALEAAHRKRVWRSLQKGSPGGGGGLKKTTSEPNLLAEIESFQRGSFNSGKAAVLDGEVSPISVTRSQSSSDGVASPIATTRSRSSTVKWFSSFKQTFSR